MSDTTYQDFYCNQSTGSNLNGGTGESSPVLTNVGGSWNGTDSFTVQGSPSLSGLVNEYCSIVPTLAVGDSPANASACKLWLRYDDTTAGGSNTSCADSSGRSRTCTVNGSYSWVSATRSWRSASAANATALKLSGGYATVADDTDFRGLAAFSVSFWLYYESPGSTIYNRIISKLSNGDGYRGWEIYYLRDAAGKIVFQVGNGAGGVTIQSLTAPVVNTWVHYTAVFTGSVVLWYVNGVLTVTTGAVGTVISSTVPLTIGDWAGNLGTGNNTNMRIMDLIFVNYQLTQSEITTLAGGTATTTTPYSAAVTDAAGSAITLSTTRKIGTAPAAGVICSAYVGGVWKGPNGTSSFPVNAINGVATDASGNPPRVLFNGQFTGLSGSWANTVTTGVVYEGYGVTPGDMEHATFSWGTSSTGGLVSSAMQGQQFRFIKFVSTATSGTAIGVDISTSGGKNCFLGCVFTGWRYWGARVAGSANDLVNCEAYDCGKANLATLAGIANTGNNHVINANCHDNTGANVSGLYDTSPIPVSGLRSYSNGRHGLNYVPSAGTITKRIESGAFYGNSVNGVYLDTTAAAVIVLIRNSGFQANSSYAIAASTTNSRAGNIAKCAYGYGEANSNLGNIIEMDSVNLGLGESIWADAENNDFEIVADVCIGTGAGGWTETASGSVATVDAVNIGGAQGAAIGGSLFAPNPFLSGVIR